MAGEMKRGWWGLVLLGVLTPFALYVIAYYYEVTPTRSVRRTDFGYIESTWLFYHHGDHGGIWMYRLFWPMHQLDRKLRPSVWPPDVKRVRH
jgi:hypothetical protein